MSMRFFSLALIGAAATAVCGCSDKLETGYEPHRLGSTAAVRRGYYASPYTPESIAAQRESAAPDLGAARPPGR